MYYSIWKRQIYNLKGPSQLMSESGLFPKVFMKTGITVCQATKETGISIIFILNPKDKKRISDWITLNADYKSCALYNQ